MTRFRTKSTVIILLVFGVATTGLSIGWAMKSKRRGTATPAGAKVAQRSQSPRRQVYVNRRAMWPQFYRNLSALGDRLERPGKERVSVHGRLAQTGVDTASRIALDRELSGRISLTIHGPGRNESIVFDGTDSSWDALTQWQRDVIATLVFDSAETFFVDHMKGSTRRLGTRFRPSADDTAGSFHDIYAVTYSGILSSDVEGAKLFYFNSDTFLLDRISYRLRRNGQSVPIEVRLSNWQDVSGQRIARTVQRIENGATVMTLSIDGVAFNPATSDGR